MHHPLPIAAASPRSISITSTTGQGPYSLLGTQHKGDRDGFKLPAHPDRFISSSMHRISTCTIEMASLPPSIPTRRAPGSQQASASIPHPAWIHSQKSPARQRSWGTPGRWHLFALQQPPPQHKDLHPIATVTPSIVASLPGAPAPQAWSLPQRAHPRHQEQRGGPHPRAHQGFNPGFPLAPREQQ